MDKTSFTFLNTTDAPGLSAQAARQVRGHVTKANFAKRRQRMSRLKEKTERNKANVDNFVYKGVLKPRKEKYGSSRAASQCQFHTTGLSSSAWLEFHYDSLSADVVHHHQALLLLTCIHRPRNLSEAAWVELIVSEPALVESTLAVGTRLWSPHPSWQRRAETHTSNALNLMIQRIGSEQAQTEGMLAAVTTMAFAERLAHNDVAWNIHIDGLAQMIRRRYSENMNLPRWLHDIIILDSINHAFNYPRVYHRHVIDAIDHTDASLIFRVEKLCDDLVRLRKSIDLTSKRLNTAFVTQEIEQPFASMILEAQELRSSSDNKAVHATAYAVEIILYLLWPMHCTPSLKLLVDELKEALLQLPIRGCAYMDFTSCLHLIGALVAQPDTDTQAWFANKLTNAAREMRSRGWQQPFEVLEIGLQSDVHLTEWFQMLRKNGLE